MKKFAIFALAMCLICCFAVLMGCQTQHATGDAASGSFEGEWAEGVQSVEFLYAGADDIGYQSFPLTEKNYRTSGILLVQGAYFNVRVTLKPGYTFGGLQLAVDGQTLEYQNDHERIRGASFRPTQETFTMSFVGTSTDVTGGLSIEVDGDVQPVGNTLTVVLDRENPITVYARLGKSVAIYGDERVIECTVDNNEIVSVESSNSSDIDAKFQIFMLADGTATLTFSAGGQTYQLVIVILAHVPVDVSTFYAYEKTLHVYQGWENFVDSITVYAEYEGEREQNLLQVSFGDPSVAEVSGISCYDYNLGYQYSIRFLFKKAGTTTVTIDAGNKTETCTLIVENKPAEVAGSPGLVIEHTYSDNVYGWWVTGLGTSTDKNLVIPNVFQGHRVRGVSSLYSKEDFAEVSNGTCEKINNVESVTVSEGVEILGRNAFNYFGNLKTVQLPNSLTEIRDSAFSGTALTEITIANNFNEIASSVFEGCEKLTKIELPDSLTTIHSRAFAGCTSLQNITLPQSVETIEDGAFSGCTALEHVNLPATLDEISGYLFWNCVSLAQITIPQGVTKIGTSAFEYCKSLNNVVIPDSVTEIGQDAFNKCESLSVLTLPHSVKRIYNRAFSYCALESVTLYDDVEYGSEYDDSVFVGNNITSIYVDSLESFAELYHVVISEMDTESQYKLYIGDNKTLLQGDITISDVEELPTGFLANYAGITGVTLNGVTTVSAAVCRNCPDLRVVRLGGTVTVGYQAFFNCDSLEEVYFSDELQSVDDSAFVGPEEPFAIYVNSLKHWLEIETGYKYVKLYVDGQLVQGALTISGVDKIRYGAFWRQPLTSVVIEDGVTEICGSAFARCEQLKEVTLPDSITTMAYDAFNYCTALETINCSDKVDVGVLSLYCCDNFKGTLSQNGLYYGLGSQVFKVKEDLTFFEITDKMTFRSGAFEPSKDTLQYLLINDANKFDYSITRTLTNLKAIVYTTGRFNGNVGDGVATVLHAASDLCTADGWIYQTAEDGKSVTIKGYIGGADQDGVVNVPATIDQLPVTAVTYVDNFGCFFKDGDVRKITFDSPVISVDTRTFVGLSNLEEIALSENVFEWDILCGVGNNNYIMNMFKDCTKLTSISAPENKDPIVFEYSSQAISATGDILTVVKAAATNDEQLVVTLRPNKKTIDINALAGHTFVFYEARFPEGQGSQYGGVEQQKRALDSTSFEMRGETYTFGDTTVKTGNKLGTADVQEYTYSVQDNTLTIDGMSTEMGTYTYELAADNTELVVHMSVTSPLPTGGFQTFAIDFVYVME